MKAWPRGASEPMATQPCKGGAPTARTSRPTQLSTRPRFCAATLRGAAAQHAREGRPVPRRVQDRMDHDVAVLDLTAAGD
eukprot:4943534-Alexandrium_andersonii.AAC.1